MDAAKLIERARAARTYTVEEGAASFVFVLPQSFDVRRAFVLARLPDGSYDDESALLRLVSEAMTAWSGVKAADLVEAAGDDPVDFSSAAAREYLADRVVLLDRLSNDMLARIQVRTNRGEADAKN